MSANIAASFLLNLAVRRADGAVSLGARRVRLRAGRVAGVDPAGDDESFEEFLVRSGRVSKQGVAEFTRDADEDPTQLQAELIRSGLLTQESARDIQRSLWLDRLVRALRDAGGIDRAAPILEPDRPLDDDAATVSTLYLVLDALVRVAADDAAAAVGNARDAHVEWLDSPHLEQARQWADLGELAERPSVARVLARAPAAAAHLAALSLAGLLQLSAPRKRSDPPASRVGTLPPPPPRTFMLPSERPPSLQLVARDPLQDVGAHVLPRLRLDPGAGGESVQPLPEVTLRLFDPPAHAQADPLVAVERRITELETQSATGPERAGAWRSLGVLWRDQLGAIEEAARAFREAVAADPSDVAILLETSRLCHALGETDLALAYARGAIGESATLSDRRAGFDAVRRIVRIGGDTASCRALLDEELARDTESLAARLELAELLAQHGDYAAAAGHARAAAALLSREESSRALTVHAWAHHMQPAEPTIATEYAKELELAGRTRAAIAILANAAQYSQELEQRRRLTLAAAQQAESHGRSDLAAELLLDAFDAEPHLDLIYTPLDEDLQASAPPAWHVAVLESLAVASAPEQRAHWLLRTAQRLLALPDQHAEACRCLYASVLADPSAPTALECLRNEARDTTGHTLLAHALRANVAARLRAGRELDALPLLEELSGLAETRLNNPHLAHAAWTQFRRLDVANAHANAEVSRLAQRIRAHEGELTAARAALAEAPAAARHDALQRLIALLPDLPDHWPEALALLDERLKAFPDDGDACTHAERIHALMDDTVGLAVLLDERTEQVSNPIERARLLTRLSGVHAQRDDPRATAQACMKLLSLEPSHALGIARLRRAARRLAEVEMSQHALSLAARAASSDPERGRILAEQMRQLEQAGDYDACLSCAEAALHADPEAVDAAIVTLRHSTRLAPAVALPILARCRALLGDSRPLFELECRAAAAAGELEPLSTLVAHWSELLPTDPLPQLLVLNASLDAGDGRAIETSSDAACHAGATPDALELCRQGVARLGELGDARAAARLALRLLDAEGGLACAPAEACVELARESGDSWLLTQALERLSARARAETRRQVLWQLADHHARLGDATGESRALMRALAVDTQDQEILGRLVMVLAAAGDADRLQAVLALRLDATTEREERRDVLLDLATVSARWQHDPQQAEFYVRSIIAENPDNAAAIRDALGALFRWAPREQALSQCFQIAEDCPPPIGGGIYLWAAATAEQQLGDPAAALHIAASGARRFPSVGELLLVVERLSLAKRDVKTALETYEQLMASAIGPHGRRALHYRAGRWLERAAQPTEAMQHYVQAFRLSPGAGVAFRAIERVAHATHDLVPLLDTYTELAEQLHDVSWRLDLLGKAAKLCSNGLNQPARAVELLLEADALATDDRYVAPLHDAVHKLRETDTDAADRALAAIASAWYERAEQAWSSSIKVRALLRLAALERDERGDSKAALQALAQAEQAAELEDIEEALLVRLHALRDETRAVTGEAPAGANANPAVAPEPLDLTEPPNTIASDIAAALAAESRPQPPPDVVDDSSLRSRAAAGDPDALLELCERLRLDPLRRAEASHMCSRALLAAPWRVDALRTLHALALELGARATAAVSAELLACFDPEVSPPVHEPLHRGLWAAEDLRTALRVDAPPALLRLLALLWEHARLIPRYRRGLADYGLSERDKLAPGMDDAWVDAYTHALRTLDLSGISLYLHADPAMPIAPLPTQPAAVQAPREPAMNAPTLRFELGRSLYLAQPHTLVLSVLPEPFGAELIEAAFAAFGPADRATAPKPAVKQLAAQLWESVPARAQSELRELVVALGTPLPFEALRRTSLLGAVRAGLYACGDARAALLATFAHAGLSAPTDATAFESGVREHPACAELVRCALSETYLAALEQALA